jgi:hypothetical protein
VSFDPIQAYFPSSANSWKGQDVRRVLEPLRRLAKERSLTVHLTMHLNRRSDAPDALARIADSQGIPQLARSVCLWGPDPTDPDGDRGSQKVLARAKSNLARSSSSASFSIVEVELDGGITAPKLIRGSDREVGADELVSDGETRKAVDEAADWLRHHLADGPVPAKKAIARAGEDGISERTLNRAKGSAGVISEQMRGDGTISGWVWRLRSITSNGHVGTLGNVGNQGKVANPAKAANIADGPRVTETGGSK